MVEDVLDVALLVGAAIDALGGEYFVGGSVASSLQGEPRATNDIDMVVAMLGHRVLAFASKLGSEKQWRDVVEVIRIRGPQLEDAHLDTWASRLDLVTLLARARSSAAQTR